MSHSVPPTQERRPQAEGPAATDPRACAVVRVPGPLRELTDGAGEVRVPATTVAEALARVVALHPPLRRHLRDEAGGLREHVNVFVGPDDIRFLDGEATAVTGGDVITLVASIAGG